MSQTAIYWLAFLAYSGLVVGMGFYVWWRRRHRKDAQDNRAYWAASKNLSGWASGLSISASMMSISWSCVYGVQLFYWHGIGGAWLLIIPWLITMGGFYWFAPLFRRLDAFSQPELLAKRFGPRSRQVLAPALIFVFIVWGGAEIYAAGITIAPFLGIPVPATLLLIALVVGAYSFTGGFEAVVSTDKIQFALVALFILIMAIVGLNAVAGMGAAGELLSVSRSAPKHAPGAPWYVSPGMAMIVMTFLAYLPGWLVETDVWIRLQAARSDQEARRGVALASLNSLVFVGILPLLIGLSALVLYPPVEGVIPAHLDDGALIFNALMRDYTPAWLNVLLGIGLVAAAMSTVDTCGNVVALSASYDLIEPRLQGKWHPERLSRLARWSSAGAIGLALLYALNTNSLQDIFYLSSGVLTTTVFLPVVAVFRPDASARQAHWAAGFGFAGTLLFYLWESHGNLLQLEPQWLAGTGVGYILFGFLCSAAGYFTGKPVNK